MAIQEIKFHSSNQKIEVILYNMASPILKRIKTLVIIFILLAVIVFTAGIYVLKSAALNIGSDQYIILTDQSDPISLSQQLEREAGLKYPKLFLALADQMNMAPFMKKGRYTVTPEMTIDELVRLFREGRMKSIDLVIAPGISLEQFADRCGNKLEADTIGFYSILEDEAFLSELGFTPQTVYAMILPDKYNIYWHEMPDELMLRLKKAYDKFWNSERKAKLQRCGLNQTEVSTLASIVSKETNKTEEMPKIAGMYINRLKIGMPLQADPSIKFALKNPGLKRILNEHLMVESPYNTYRNKGLPPGPICIPGKASIDAVLNFEEHNYLYMCAKEDFSGFHNFADNYTTHLKFAALYRKALDARGIK